MLELTEGELINGGVGNEPLWVAGTESSTAMVNTSDMFLVLAERYYIQSCTIEKKANPYLVLVYGEGSRLLLDSGDSFIRYERSLKNVLALGLGKDWKPFNSWNISFPKGVSYWL